MMDVNVALCTYSRLETVCKFFDPHRLRKRFNIVSYSTDVKMSGKPSTRYAS